MKWLIPRSLVSRVAVLMALALLAIQVISISLYLRDQANAATTVFAEFNAERIVHLVETLDSLTRSQRDSLLPAVNSPTLITRLTESGPELDAIPGSGELDLLLAKGLDRPLAITDVPRGDSSLTPDPFESQRKRAYWIRLQDGQWVHFISPSQLPSLGWIVHMSALLGLVSLLLIAFVAWAVHRLTQPIRSFAAAAEKLGAETDAPDIELESQELEQAGLAFNNMARRLQRYVSDRTHMLAAISHDLRTSLTRLRLRTQFIDDPEQASKAEQDIEEMEAMLESTLAFARDDAANEALSPVDIATMVHTLCDDLADQGHEVSFKGPTSLEWTCRPVSLGRAISNLLNNAIRYGNAAEVELSESGDDIEFRICDRGPGIPEADLEHVFEPFIRLDTARSKSSGGSGLGLAIARSAIHSHGGNLSLSNRPQGGLQVLVQLPR
jgi:signal transduction histidine kinase